MSDKNLSEEDKKKKQEEVEKRLAEIKNRLNKPNLKKSENSDDKKNESVKTTGTNPSIENKEDSASVKKSTTSESKPVKQEVKKSDSQKPEDKKISPNLEKKPNDENKKTEPTKEPGFKMVGKPSKDKSWSNNKIKKESAAPKLSSDIPPKFVPQPKKRKRNKSALLILTSAVIVLLACALVWFFLIRESADSSVELNTDSTLIESESSLNANNNDELNQEATVDIESNDPTLENIEESTEKASDPTKKPKPKKVNSVKEIPVSTPKSENTSNVARANLTLPCFVISYVSVGNEDNAKRKVRELQNKGLAAGYYWIPDYTAGGSSLFKVFVGPYPNRKSAHEDLDRIRTFKKDVYYHIVE